MVTEVKLATICVVGAGYVGLPLSKAFAGSYNVISFDIDANRVKTLSEQNANPNHIFTAEPALISEADFISVCVPTPLGEGKRPDMSYIREAAVTIGRYMKKGAIVILESSVYPGATEEVFKPALEEASGYQCGKDFGLAYSPERINPGDSEHNVDKVTKIVAACDGKTLDAVADLYRRVTPNIFRARNIRTAEAAKLVENTQRDLNIALMNELSIIFQAMGIDTADVLDAAATKWNFQKFSPGLVGGYCIPVVPHFLAHKAQEHGYHPQVILAGRAVNDCMPGRIAQMAASAINATGKAINGSRVLIMGCTYKENVADTRETPVRKVIKELHTYGVEVYGYDPLVMNGQEDFGIRFFELLADVPRVDCIILAVAHDVFRGISLCELRAILSPHPVIIDVRGAFDASEIRAAGIIYKRL